MTLFPYTTLFRSGKKICSQEVLHADFKVVILNFMRNVVFPRTDVLNYCWDVCNVVGYIFNVVPYMWNVSENAMSENDTSQSNRLVGRTGTIDELHALYRKHAKLVGFNVRKSTSRYNTEGKLCEKYFVCSCAGTPKTSKTPPITPIKPVEIEGFEADRKSVV